ncbi:HutD/Ves family protein [Chitinimonas lacunae]|uniref:HutD family protein n=1 Tax=Chitinimonas lacunae TaxID=1963018 RepID=A0ABV8MVG4_9NEIS
MPIITLFTPADYQTMPWKNGGGSTLELLRQPYPGDPARFLYRVSIATVAADGPFSHFPGVERWLMLLEGAGMELALSDGRTLELDRPLHPLRFAGELEVVGELFKGPIRDFNLMVDRNGCAAELEVVRLGASESQYEVVDDCLLLYLLEGGLTLRQAGQEHDLAPQQLLRIEGAGAWKLLAAGQGAVAVVMRLHDRTAD